MADILKHDAHNKNMTKKVRTRVAPSPTGDPHVGTAYMALFSMVFAHSQGGEFVVRIEDTDAARSTLESETRILESLRWLKLKWDEGPDIGGPHAPYRQSERTDLYRRYANELVERGHAFHCFCTTARLDQMRKSQATAGETTRYDGLCRALSAQEVRSRIDSGEDHVIRMVVPGEGNCTIHDLLRGEIEIEWCRVDMQVLIKSDGNPTYHLAVVVDDHLMEITHIIRGEEWISSAPKHQLLFEYFGWEMPVLIHMPLLRNPDKSKLSKRKNPTSIEFYRKMGFLPEAVINYLGMLGWSMPDGEEKFSVEQMLDSFSIERISLGAPVFDIEKLKWLNGRWLREEMDDDQFADRLVEWSLNRDYLLKVIPMIKERVDVFSDIAPLAHFLLAGMPAVKDVDFASKNLSPDDVKKVLQFSLWRLEAIPEWNKNTLNEVFVTLADDLGFKIRDLLAPIFVAISGSSVSLPLFDSMALLGTDMTRARFRHGLDVLGGLSNKQQKRLDKEFRSLGGEVS